MCAGCAFRKVDDVTGLELVLPGRRPERRASAQHEDQLFVPVMEVVGTLCLPRQELVDAHSEHVPRRDEAPDVRLPALDLGVELLPIVREQVPLVRHAASFGSGAGSSSRSAARTAEARSRITRGSADSSCRMRSRRRASRARWRGEGFGGSGLFSVMRRAYEIFPTSFVMYRAECARESADLAPPAAADARPAYRG